MMQIADVVRSLGSLQHVLVLLSQLKAFETVGYRDCYLSVIPIPVNSPQVAFDSYFHTCIVRRIFHQKLDIKDSD